MKKFKSTGIIMAAGLLLTVFISNIGAFISDGRKLDELRGSVLRLHILANSDSDEDQRLKLCVRDALLEKSSDIFGDAESLESAEAAAQDKLGEIEKIAEKTLRAQGCSVSVKAELTDMYFNDRVYGDITMPAGEYRALRIEIGEAKGHNWWCVMYPPLCIPAACGVKTERKTADEAETITEDKDVEADFFDEDELDIMYHPKKYRIRFALWDKIKSFLEG